MKTNKDTILRTITAAAALAVVGFAPAAEAASAGLFKKSEIGPNVEIKRPVLEILDPSIGPAPTPLPAPLPAPFPGPLPLLPLIKTTKVGSTLKVIGTNASDDVDVRIDDTGSNRVYVYNHDTLVASFESYPIKRIEVNLKGGHDKYFIGLASGASHKFTKKIDVKLGSGNDKGFVDFRGSTYNAIVQGSLDVKVNAGNGNDETIAHFARKHGGALKFKCTMGGGDDNCSASMWGDITGGADVEFELFGNGGKDNLWSWNTYDKYQGGYTNIRIAGDATMDILMDGGSGADKLTPTYGGEVDGDLTLRVKGRGGADSSFGVVNLSSSGGEVDLKTLGNNGGDDLRLDVFGSTPYFSAMIDGGTGYNPDTCQSTPNVVKINCP